MMKYKYMYKKDESILLKSNFKSNDLTCIIDMILFSARVMALCFRKLGVIHSLS